MTQELLQIKVYNIVSVLDRWAGLSKMHEPTRTHIISQIESILKKYE